MEKLKKPITLGQTVTFNKPFEDQKNQSNQLIIKEGTKASVFRLVNNQIHLLFENEQMILARGFDYDQMNDYTDWK